MQPNLCVCLDSEMNINTRLSFLVFSYSFTLLNYKKKMLNIKFACLFFAFFAFFSMTHAMVVNPTVLTPTTGTKWRAGGTYVVKWETTYFDGEKQAPIPSGQRGYIKLGYLEKDDPDNEHITWDLADDFPLDSGAQTVTLPSELETKTSYIIILFGDSGNISKKFTIQAARS